MIKIKMLDTAKLRIMIVITIEIGCTFDFCNLLKINKKTFLWMYICKISAEKGGLKGG